MVLYAGHVVELTSRERFSGKLAPSLYPPAYGLGP